MTLINKNMANVTMMSTWNLLETRRSFANLIHHHDLSGAFVPQEIMQKKFASSIDTERSVKYLSIQIVLTQNLSFVVEQTIPSVSQKISTCSVVRKHSLILQTGLKRMFASAGRI